MKTSSSTAELFTALAKAQGERAHPAIESALISEAYNIIHPVVIRPGRQHAKRDLITRLLERCVCGWSDCWHVVTAKNGLGYARMTYEGRMQMMHRLSYQAFNGSIPRGMSVLHSCDNRACINPEHLSLGTYSDNLKQCWDRGRRVAGKRNK